MVKAQEALTTLLAPEDIAVQDNVGNCHNPCDMLRRD